MMLQATDFKPVTASIFPSQTAEITLGKQHILGEHGAQVRAAISQLPPEVTRLIMGPYAEPRLSLFSATEAAIIQRELAVENAAQEVNLDKKWLSGAAPRSMNENSVGAEDDWNLSP